MFGVRPCNLRCLRIDARFASDFTKYIINKYSVKSEEKNLRKSIVPEIDVTYKSLDEYIWKNLDKWRKKTAVVCGLSDRKLTYEELHRKSRALARSLRLTLNLEKGDRVATILPNCPEYTVIILAIIYANLTLVPLNPQLTAGEILIPLEESKVSAVFALNDLCYFIEETLHSVGMHKVPIIGVKFHELQKTPISAKKFESLCKNDLKFESDSSLNDVAILPYSMGTGGLPKGVQITQGNILYNILQIRHEKFRVVEEPSGEEQTIIPQILPLFHVYGITFGCLHNVGNGVKLVTLPKFHMSTFLDVCKNYKPTVLPCVPIMLRIINNSTQTKPQYFDSVKLVTLAGDALDPVDVEKFQKMTKNRVKFIQGYGMTETLMTHLQRVSDNFDPKSVGELVPCTECKVVKFSESQQSTEGLGPNEPGELWVRGPQVMKGYLSRNTDSQQLVDGWMKTGDLGYYDEKGMFFLTGRMKDMLLVKGLQVSPAQLEAVLLSHPDVAEAVVIGVSNEQFGVVPRAYVVAKEGVKINLFEVKRFANSQLADFKRFRGGIIALESLPKTQAGVPDRAKIAKMTPTKTTKNKKKK